MPRMPNQPSGRRCAGCISRRPTSSQTIAGRHTQNSSSASGARASPSAGRAWRRAGSPAALPASAPAGCRGEHVEHHRAGRHLRVFAAVGAILDGAAGLPCLAHVGGGRLRLGRCRGAPPASPPRRGAGRSRRRSWREAPAAQCVGADDRTARSAPGRGSRWPTPRCRCAAPAGGWPGGRDHGPGNSPPAGRAESPRARRAATGPGRCGRTPRRAAALTDQQQGGDDEGKAMPSLSPASPDTA